MQLQNYYALHPDYFTENPDQHAELISDIADIRRDGVRFGRMRFCDGRILSSRMNHRQSLDARVNYNVAVEVEVDHYMRQAWRPPHYVKCGHYGSVEYYFVHEFRNRKHMIAYIHWTSPPQTHPTYGYQYFKSMDYRTFQDVECIDRTVAFIPFKSNRNFIFDREWATRIF
jgi:hypothetical protein